MLRQNTLSIGINYPDKKKYQVRSETIEAKFCSLVQIGGSFLPNIEYINLNHLIYKTKNQVIRIALNSHHFIPPEAFPVNYRQFHLFLVLDEAPNQLRFVSNFKIDIEGIANYKASCSSIICAFPGLSIHSQALANECQSLLGSDLPIETSKIPILKTNEQQPPIEYLDCLYHDFYQFNKHKLNSQLKLFDGVCHLRAHFVSQFLETLGIETIKVYKFYDTDSWQNFPLRTPWKFHCATMMIDSENNKWIWDPWDGKNKNLQSFKDWTYRNDQPTPIKIMLANKAIISDLRGIYAGGTDFEIFATPREFDTFQLMFTNALPNEPEKCLLSEDDKKAHLNYLENNKQSLITKKTPNNLKTLGLFKPQNTFEEDGENPSLYRRLGCNII